MTDREIELRLKRAVEASTPNVLGRVMEECNKQEVRQQKDVLVFPKRKYSMLAACAVLFLFIGVGMFTGMRLEARKVASIVSIEINPSMELKLNKKKEVLEVNALNADAEIIL